MLFLFALSAAVVTSGVTALLFILRLPSMYSSTISLKRLSVSVYPSKLRYCLGLVPFTYLSAEIVQSILLFLASSTPVLVNTTSVSSLPIS